MGEPHDHPKLVIVNRETIRMAKTLGILLDILESKQVLLGHKTTHILSPYLCWLQ